MHLADRSRRRAARCGRRPDLQLDAAADPAAGLDQQHVGAGAREVAGAREARQARADHDHVNSLHRRNATGGC